MYVAEHILVLISTTKKYGMITADEKMQATEAKAKSTPCHRRSHLT